MVSNAVLLLLLLPRCLGADCLSLSSPRRAVSSEMAKRIQGSEDAEGIDDLPDDADRALSIVRNKLDTRLSVQYSVNQLIQEATDVRHLATIFSGKSSLLGFSCVRADQNTIVEQVGSRTSETPFFLLSFRFLSAVLLRVHVSTTCTALHLSSVSRTAISLFYPLCSFREQRREPLSVDGISVVFEQMGFHNVRREVKLCTERHTKDIGI